ncbi:MAG: Zn-ribbon domain-containing OB-fold protein [Gammaproteobacteria bacterium]
MNKHAVSIDLHLQYRHMLGELAPYFYGLERGEAVASRCPVCNKVWFPPRLVCARDRVETEWTELSGSGTVISVTTGHGLLPLAAVGEQHTFALIALDGADNAAFGRIVSRALVGPGDRVRITKNPQPARHPAQAAYYT